MKYLKSLLTLSVLISSQTAQAEITGPYGGVSMNIVQEGTWDWFSNDAYRATFDLEGSAPGLFAGYNWKTGPIIWGVELAYNSEGIADPTDTGYNFQSITDLKARIGVQKGKVFIYGFAGPSFGRWDDFYVNVDAPGKTYGLGAEVTLSDRAFIGLELSKRDLVAQYTNQEGASSGQVFRHELTLDTIQFRMGMRF